jgi:dihydrofolate reductase
MRKIIYQPWISLDGFAADADNSTKFFEDRKYGVGSDEDLHAYMDNIDTILLGANTYKLFVEYWPKPEADTELMAETLNRTPKIVSSKSLKEAPWGKWPAAEVISSDAIAAVKKLKAQNGKHMVLWGSMLLANAFIKENLIDEFHIRVVPIVLGKGTPLFKNKSALTLELFDSKRYSSGVVLLQYKP